MSTFENLKAAVDLRDAQYHLVRLSGALTVNISSADSQTDGIGVLVNRPNSGRAASVSQGPGVEYVTTGAAVSANVFITSNGSGRAIAASSGDLVYGRSLEASAADGDIVRCNIFPPFILPR